MRLRDELAQRGLHGGGGTVFAGLHHGAEALRRRSRISARRPGCSRGRREVPGAPARAVHRHAHRRGHRVRPSSMPSMENLVSGTNELGRVILRGVRRRAGVPPARRHPRRHPGADGAVPHRHRPRYVNLCLDTGHISYCGGDNIADHRAVPGADHLCAPQAGRPGGAGAGQRGEPAAGRGGASSA